MKTAPTAAPETRRVDDLVKDIKTEKTKLDKGEIKLLHPTLTLCRLMAELRNACREKAWKISLKQIGMHARVASRRVKIGKTWLVGSGLTESDLPPCMPADELKLEWLCRLERIKLTELAGEHDLRAKSRAFVIQAVKEMLGEAVHTEVPIAKDVERAIRQLYKISERLPAEPVPAELASKMLAALGETHDALTADRGTSDPAAA